MDAFKDKDFHSITANEPPRDLAILLNSMIKENATVLDLGCGAGVDSQYFLENGHSVIAVDREVTTIEEKKKAIDNALAHRLQVIKADFNDLDFPKADVIYASYSLPFCGKSNFSATWQNQFETLPKGTVIGIVLFGHQDAWFGHNDYLVFHSEEEAKALLNAFEINHYENLVYEGTCMSSDGSTIDKLWHVMNIVAVKNN